MLCIRILLWYSNSLNEYPSELKFVSALLGTSLVIFCEKFHLILVFEYYSGFSFKMISANFILNIASRDPPINRLVLVSVSI